MKNIKNTKNNNTRNNIEHIIVVIILIIFIVLVIMIYKSNIFTNNTSTFIKEGFAVKKKYSKKHKNEKFKNIKQKKAKRNKNDPYDINVDYSKYGTRKFYEQLPKKSGNSLSKFKRQINDKYSKSKDMGKEKFENTKHETLLRELDDDANPGKYDNFQNVLDELDNIDAEAFKLNNMNSVLTSYNDNLKNRLNYAGKKGLNRFDATMSKGSVLLDEFKKLFSYNSFFK